MADPFKYASSKLPEKIKKAIASGGVSKIVVFLGGREACLAYYAKNTAAKLYEFADAYADGSKTSFFTTGEPGVYIDYKNYGRDMAVHKVLLYHFAGMPLAGLEIATPSAGIGAAAGGKAFPHANGGDNPLFASSVKAAGRCDFAIIGYVRSFVRDFTLRKLARLKAAYIKDVISSPASGEAARRAIIKALEASRAASHSRPGPAFARDPASALDLIAGSDPAMFFTDSRYYFALAGLEAALLDSPGGGPPEIMTRRGFKYYPIGGVYDLKAGEYVREAGFDVRRFDVLAGGAWRRLLIARHPYGDQAAALAGELYGAGARRILFLGSCGGFDAGLRPGDILVSRRFFRYDENSRMTAEPGVNDLWRDLSGRPASFRLARRILLKDHHVSVPSPLIETAAVVDDLRAMKVSSVDCEAAHLFENASPLPVKSAAFIVTDLPLGGHTLESYDSNSPAMLEAQMRALDLAIEYFGIEDVAVK